MTLLSPDYHIDIDGVDLATYATGLEVVDGIENIPGRRLNRQPSAYIDGVYPALDTPSFYDMKRQRIRVWVAATDEDGDVTHSKGPMAHLQENMETLKALLGGKAISNHVVSWTVPTPTGNRVLTNNARISLPVRTQGSTRLIRRLNIDLEYPWPFFQDSTFGEQTLGPFTGAQSFTPGGTAPLADALFICTAAGSITHTQTGDVITVTSIPSTSVWVNQRPPKTVTNDSASGSDARAVYDADHPWGLRFDAGVLANLTITGTWEIRYFNAEH